MAGLEDEALAGPTRWARIALVAGLVYWTWQFAFTPLGQDAMDAFIHLPNLVFHEAGHLIFSPLGQFMTVLGGSLMQVLIPIVAAIAFIRQEQTFGAAICVWWAGQNLVDLAPYIADARALQLVLLGGRTGAEVEGHDWEFILTRLRLVHRDQAIGRVAHAAGMLTMIVSLAFAVRSIVRKSE
ncbi:MAG TPA: hypothetical protein VFZ38_09020 [Vicinamibacterales bacterium]